MANVRCASSTLAVGFDIAHPHQEAPREPTAGQTGCCSCKWDDIPSHNSTSSRLRGRPHEHTPYTCDEATRGECDGGSVDGADAPNNNGETAEGTCEESVADDETA